MSFSSITTLLPLLYFRIKLMTLLYPGQMFPSRCNRGSERWCGITIRQNLEHTLCNRVNAVTKDPLLNPESECSIIIFSYSSGRRSNGFESSSARFTFSALPSPRPPLCPYFFIFSVLCKANTFIINLVMWRVLSFLGLNDRVHMCRRICRIY